jgi:hypothetical protein
MKPRFDEENRLRFGSKVLIIDESTPNQRASVAAC